MMKKAISTGAQDADLLRMAGVTLVEGESRVASAAIHGAIFWKGVAVAILGLLLLLTFAFSLGLFLLFVAAVMLGIAYLTRQYLIVAATDRRIFIRSGIVYTDMIELRYSQVESIELGITPIGQIFNYASLIVTGTGQRRIIVPFVANAFAFRTRVNDALVAKTE